MNKQTKIETAGDALTAIDTTRAALAKLREPFPAHQISKLPKPLKKDSTKGKCAECGGYHGLPAIHLDYVGHAALTDRLLDVDPEWSWEPMGRTPEGLPVVNGGLWIKLTVCGVSRYGFGAADGKQGGDAIKEMIGDALRNAAMRFGAALDLWHKGDLHVDEGGGDDTRDEPALASKEQVAEIERLAPMADKTIQELCEAFDVSELGELSQDKAGKCISRLEQLAKEDA